MTLPIKHNKSAPPQKNFDKDAAQKKDLTISLQGGKHVTPDKKNDLWSATVQDVLTRQL